MVRILVESQDEMDYIVRTFSEALEEPISEAQVVNVLSGAFTGFSDFVIIRNDEICFGVDGYKLLCHLTLDVSYITNISLVFLNGYSTHTKVFSISFEFNAKRKKLTHQFDKKLSF